MHASEKFLKKFLDIRQLLSYILWYHGSMDITAYWLNHKRRDAGEGKVYYLYPYTRCEADDTPTLFIGGKHYIRIAVSEEEWTRLRKLDDKEYNSERRAHNKRWTADIPRLRDEDGEEIDFWSDRAEDKRTHYIEDDICEEMDRRAAVKCLSPLERRIYREDREGYTQSEIAKMVRVNQATVSRKLDKIYERMDAVRLYDGDRSWKELAFEIGWESFLRNRFMKNDADVRAFAFFLRAQGKLLELLYKWFFTPGELLRYAARYLMVGGKETREELLAQVSEPAKEFFFQRFQKEPNWMQMLCLRIIRELERRVAMMPEPSGNVFHGMEQAIEELAHRRKMTYDFYLDEILQRKYRFRCNRRMLAYARRIVSKTRDITIKVAMRQEIASLEQDQRKIIKDLKRVIRAHKDSLPPEIAAKIYKNTTKKTDKN